VPEVGVAPNPELNERRGRAFVFATVSILDILSEGHCYRLIFATTQGPDLAGIVGAGLKLGPMG
jgi:hypothetical protein